MSRLSAARRPSVAPSELARLNRVVDLMREGVEAISHLTDPATVAGAAAVHIARITDAQRVVAGWVEDGVFQPKALAEAGHLRPNVDVGEHETAVAAAVLRTARPMSESGCLAVPALDHHGRVTAVVVAHRSAEYSPSEIRAVRALAHAAAVGIDRGRLFDRLVEWNKSLEMLLAFSAAINQHSPPPVLLRRLVEQAARLLNADAGFAGLVVPDGIGGLAMETDGYYCGGHWQDGRRRWKRGEGTPGFVLESEFPYFSNDYPSDPRADSDRVGVRRIMCVPIKNEWRQLLGFFELHRSGGPLFSWHDAAFLESLANSAGIAVENARLWRSLEESNRQLQTMSAANARRVEEERRRLARELHDETGQALIGIKLGLQAVTVTVPSERADIRAELEMLKQQVNDAAVQIKELARRLRPPTLDHCGLATALRQLAEDFGRRTGLKVRVIADELTQRYGMVVETAIYRIAQEALTNTAKHAHAHSILLTLVEAPDQLRFTAADDGHGFDPDAASDGLGLLGMRERVDVLGGSFRLTSAPGQGVVIEVSIPVIHVDTTSSHSGR